MHVLKKFSKHYRKFLRLPRNLFNKKRLKNKNFSIFSCNCIGGVIYHELNLPFLSPTINLFFKANDFIKFISNLTFYLDCPLTQVFEEGISYPIGLLYDIRLYFVHYPTFEDAVSKWNIRKERVIFSNIYIIMVEREGCTYDNIVSFDKLPYEHKIIFTHKLYPEIKSSYYIPNSETYSQVRDLTSYIHRFTGTRYIDRFDYVHWLNK